jgi:hypothetical protein
VCVCVCVCVCVVGLLYAHCVCCVFIVCCLLQDLDKCVSVYVAKPTDTQKPWHFLAKYRSHFKKIEGQPVRLHCYLCSDVRVVVIRRYVSALSVKSQLGHKKCKSNV